MHVIPLNAPWDALRIGVFGVQQCETEIANKHLYLNGVACFSLENGLDIRNLVFGAPLRLDTLME